MTTPCPDCPICMEQIESFTKNCVTTECGHCFHTSCLMTSVAHNGFGCPYCRTAMAKKVVREAVIPSEPDEPPPPLLPNIEEQVLRMNEQIRQQNEQLLRALAYIGSRERPIVL
jgi:hypothetical protein